MKSISEPQTLIAKTLHGLEPVLVAELQALGATEIIPLRRAVSFRGDQEMIYRTNYELRTALRVLVPVITFMARDEGQFYARVRDMVDWTKLMDVSDTLAVDAVTQSGTFRHSQYMALTVKDAIVDQFRDKFNRRPDVNTIAPTLRIHLRIHENRCDLLLDSSGESLHKRGYRREQLEAPLNEVLAAGMLMHAGWTGDSVFVDPMCGSGTLPIEAALIAKCIPSQRFREHFGFMRWKDFDKKLWQKVKKEGDAKEKPLENAIYAYDKEPRARNASAVNAMAANLDSEIQFQKANFETLEPPAETGLLFTNPPYDERLKLEQISEFYAMIGQRFKHNWQGWAVWLISSNRDALNAVHLKPAKKIQLFNGSLDCVFQKYEMYEGKKIDTAESVDVLPDNQ